MKIVINKCFGGFSVSIAATKRWNELKDRPCYIFVPPEDNIVGKGVPYIEGMRCPLGIYFAYNVSEGRPDNADSNWDKAHDVSIDRKHRADPDFVKVVEELGSAANGRFALLSIVEIPDDVQWEINNYDGMESVEETHRSWS